MSHYLDEHSTHRTPQSEPIPGSTQVPNSAGGYAWAVDDWTRLQRFLIMGSEGGSFYAGERDLTKENVDAVRRCIAADGPRVVREVLDVSTHGRAPKQDQGVFVLALCASVGVTDVAPARFDVTVNDPASSAQMGEARRRYENHAETRRQALAAVPHVCRYGTTLFMFVRFCEQHRGWGRGLRNAIASWYTEPHFNTARRAEGEEVADSHVDDLAYQLVKYRQRDGFTHRDLLRLAHPKTEDEALGNLLAWAAGKGDKVPKRPLPKDSTMPKGWRRSPFPSSVIAYEAAQKATSPDDVVALLGIFGNKLPREAIPDEFKDIGVWQELIKADMPMTALIRNLATMTRLNVLTPTSHMTQIVIDQIKDADRVRKARVHPLTVLNAMRTYESGKSVKGSSTWTPIAQIVDALDEAFYFSFDNVEPTGKRYLIGLDVSASMDGNHAGYGWPNCMGSPNLTPREASAAMAMVCMKVGDPYEVVAFTSGGMTWSGGFSTGVTPVPLSPNQRLTDVINTVRSLPAGGTDASLPIAYAAQNHREVDVFALYTDAETWAGRVVHPSQAIKEYRQASGINAKLITVSMVANRFSISDPADGGMLDVVGFDTATPTIMASFATG